MDVDERGQAGAADRDDPGGHPIELGGHGVGGELAGVDLFEGDRLVLVLGEEGRLVLELEVHRVLDG